MTPQQMFDLAVPAVIRQGRPSYDPNTESCLYRGPDGTKCALGHLVTDEQLRALAKSRGITLESLVYDTIAEAIGLEGDLVFAAKLQECHDQATTLGPFVPQFVRLCHELADEFELSEESLLAALAQHDPESVAP